MKPLLLLSILVALPVGAVPISGDLPFNGTPIGSRFNPSSVVGGIVLPHGGVLTLESSSTARQSEVRFRVDHGPYERAFSNRDARTPVLISPGTVEFALFVFDIDLLFESDHAMVRLEGADYLLGFEDLRGFEVEAAQAIQRPEPDNNDVVIRVAPIPEPGAVTLVGGGLAGLCAWMRTRRKRA